VFLDRDGTMNVRPPEHKYVTAPREFVWLAGAREGIARLAHAGYAIAVVSNQRGFAGGFVTSTLLEEIEHRIQLDLSHYGCAVDAFRYCFHGADDGCACRKPKPGMILALAEELDLDLSRSWMIGDMDSDVLAGQAAGCRTVLLGTPSTTVSPDLVAPSLEDAGWRLATASTVSSSLRR
jgi:D-glycero-D-manno-heptose 1,7-bisphosphate phosphatase